MVSNEARRCFPLLIQTLPTFWATRIMIFKICILLYVCLFFTTKMHKIAPNGARMIVSLLIQTLPTFWAERIWILRFCFWFVGPTFLDLQVARVQHFQISRFPDFQTPPPLALDELSDPNLTPLPTHPGIKYVARSPCCDKHVSPQPIWIQIYTTRPGVHGVCGGLLTLQ